MATFYDTYEIDLKFDSKTTNIDPSNVSFSLKDSIHTLFPILTMNLVDTVGIYQEYLLTSENIPITISFGLKESYITCPFVLTQEEIVKLISNNNIAGENYIEGLHSYYDSQEITSNGYKNRISSVMQELANKFNFNQINIDGTGCNTYWYQPLITDAEFMEEILLPNCFSYDSKDSPFFLYITSNNNFNLKSFFSIYSQPPKKKFKYLHKDLKNPEDDVIIKLNKFKTGSDITKYTRNRLIFQYDKDDGSLVEDDDNMTSYPSQVITKNSNKILPLFDDTKISSYIDLGKKGTDVGETEYKKGQKINSMKDSLFLERFLVTVYLDTSIHAGDVIEIEIPHFKSDDNNEKSMYFSGYYVVEESEHIWDSTLTSGRATTKLLCSRKYLNNLPNASYNLVSKLKKG